MPIPGRKTGKQNDQGGDGGDKVGMYLAVISRQDFPCPGTNHHASFRAFDEQCMSAGEGREDAWRTQHVAAC